MNQCYPPLCLKCHTYMKLENNHKAVCQKCGNVYYAKSNRKEYTISDMKLKSVKSRIEKVNVDEFLGFLLGERRATIPIAV